MFAGDRIVWRRAYSLRFVVAWVGTLLAVPCVAIAADAVATVEPAGVAAPWREIAVGATVTPLSWALYSSATIAPLGGLDADGVRLRLGSGYGKYRYDTLPPARGDCRYGFGDGRTKVINGRVTFADILAGYQLGIGNTTIKAFAGLAMDQQELTPLDICNRNSGRDLGFKAVVETWTNLTPAIWLALDGSWTQAHETYSARARLGYRVLPQLSIGFEEALLGNISGDLARSGLFARYDWSGGEVALAAGVSGQRFDFKDTSTDRTWMALSVMFRF